MVDGHHEAGARVAVGAVRGGQQVLAAVQQGARADVGAIAEVAVVVEADAHIAVEVHAVEGHGLRDAPVGRRAVVAGQRVLVDAQITHGGGGGVGLGRAQCQRHRGQRRRFQQLNLHEGSRKVRVDRLDWGRHRTSGAAGARRATL
jgi:hypothetical protein